MEFKKYLDTHRGLLSERTVHRFTTPLALLVAVCALTVAMSKDIAVAIVPPNLSESARVSQNSADESYKKAWALFTTTMMGNVTPGNVDFLLKNLQMVFAPNVFQKLRGSIADSVDRINQDKVSTTFEAKSTWYEPETDRVYVTGRYSMRDPSGEEISSTRTYEYVIGVHHYKPEVTFFDTYPGPPKVERMKKADEKKAEAARRKQRREGAPATDDKSDLTQPKDSQ